MAFGLDQWLTVIGRIGHRFDLSGKSLSVGRKPVHVLAIELDVRACLRF